MDINDQTIRALATSLNMRELRGKIINSNVANAQTPGYKAKRLDFEDALRRALDIDKRNSLQVQAGEHFNVGGGGFDHLKPEIYEDPNGVVSEDGNTVNLEDELVKLEENQLLYEAAVQLLNKKMGMKKYILSSER